MLCITANERPQSVIKLPTAAGQRERTFGDLASMFSKLVIMAGNRNRF
jgi:hypothetical protein